MKPSILGHVILVFLIASCRGNSTIETMRFDYEEGPSSDPKTLNISVRGNDVVVIEGSVFNNSSPWSKITFSGDGASSLIFTVDSSEIASGGVALDKGTSNLVTDIIEKSKDYNVSVLTQDGTYHFSGQIPSENQFVGTASALSSIKKNINNKRSSRRNRQGIGTR